MLVKGNQVIGLKLVSLENGKELNTVKDLIYDPGENRVKALLIEGGGLFSEAKAVALEDIRSIGHDAVVVENRGALKPASRLGQKVAQIAGNDSYLTKTNIITEQGNELGKVSDIFFDPENGRVEEFELSKGSLSDIGEGRKRVKVSDVITVGEDATIVRSQTEDAVREQQGGLQAKVEEGRAQSQGWVAMLQDWWSRMTGQARDEFSSYREDVEDWSDREKRRQKISEAQAKLDDLWQDLRLDADRVRQKPRVRETQRQVGEKVEDAGEYMGAKMGQVGRKVEQKSKQAKKKLEGR